MEQIRLIGNERSVEVQVVPTARDDHAGLGGPFTLIETLGRRRIAYAEVASMSGLLTERKAVREPEAQYGIIRARALAPCESLAYIEKLPAEA